MTFSRLQLTFYFLEESLEAIGMLTAQDKLHFSTHATEQLSIWHVIDDQTGHWILITFLLLY